MILRPAKPTFEEGLVFAGYLDQAAEGFFRFMLGRDVAHIVATVYAQPDHDLSFQNVTFAERDGVVVGMVSGFTAAQHRASPQGLLKRAAGRWNLRMTAVATLCAPLLRIIDTLDEGDFYLQAIAVDEELRGEGVGSTLWKPGLLPAIQPDWFSMSPPKTTALGGSTSAAGWRPSQSGPRSGSFLRYSFG